MTTISDKKRLATKALFASFSSHSSDGSLADLSMSLLEKQKKGWPLLADAHSFLVDTKLRELHCDDFTVSLQFNPKRIVSTSAKVDEKSVSERKCFLCTGNLPKEQAGILYNDSFLILCNPAPIFPQHFTISHVDHIRQEVEGFIGTFLSLAKDLGSTFTVLYNGARCGASAPDHLHFQTIPSSRLHVEKDADGKQRKILTKKAVGVSFFVLQNYGREVLVIESDDKVRLEASMMKFFKAMKKETNSEQEPMFNLLCSYAKDAWRVIVFPRGKHRPEVYYKEGNARVLVSPAAIDMGGLVITPLERDFERIDETMIEGIFEEVSIDHRIFETIIDGI